MANGRGRASGQAGGSGEEPRRRRSFLQGLIYWTLVLGVWGLIALVAVFAVFATDLPDTSKIFDVTRQPSISYLDRSGGQIAVRGSQFSPPVDLGQLPPYVPAAFVSIEDQRFYHHFGFDPIGIARSMVADLRAGHLVQGASTITQQLARNLFLTPDQTIRRKVQELILAVWLETKFSKKQILSLYLNRVYFGEGAYGIEAASQRYFNKPASQLSVGEAALLAGLMKGPSRYSPVSATARAERRATIVLDKMVETGAITTAQRDQAFAEPVRVSATLANQNAQYFIDWIDQQVRGLVGQPQEDLVVETTLDLPIQQNAEHAVRGVLTRDGPAKGVQQAALVALDGEGRVRAYVGGADYVQSPFDRASMAQRQAGSAFKPFVYLTAMEHGRTPSEAVVDEPITIGNWQPRNYTGKYLGAITLQTALAQSINTVAARLANEVGTSTVAATAHRLGIVSPIQTGPSMALGAVEVTPIEMAQAYAAFSNGGLQTKAYGIERIRTASGRVLYDHNIAAGARNPVIGQPALAYMIQMMREVVADGTGARAKIGGYDLAGKTGTTSDYRDAWFIGYTGGFTAAVWTGRDDNTPMRKVTGGGAPAEIWRGFMATSLPRLNVQTIPGASPPTGSGDVIGDLLNQAARQRRSRRRPSRRAAPAAAGRPAAGRRAAAGLAESMQPRAVGPQPGAVRSLVAHQAVQHRPVASRMVGFDQMGAFVRGDVVHHRVGREHQPPGVADAAHLGRRAEAARSRLAAGAPAGAGVHDRDHRHRLAEHGGVDPGPLDQHPARLGLKQPGDAAREGFTLARRDQGRRRVVAQPAASARGRRRLQPAGPAQHLDGHAGRDRRARRAVRPAARRSSRPAPRRRRRPRPTAAAPGRWR